MCYYIFNALGGDDELVFNQTEYMKSRRESKKTFSALVDKEKMEKLEKKLKDENLSKTKWLEKKIDEELDKK